MRTLLLLLFLTLFPLPGAAEKKCGKETCTTEKTTVFDNGQGLIADCSTERCTKTCCSKPTKCAKETDVDQICVTRAGQGQKAEKFRPGSLRALLWIPR